MTPVIAQELERLHSEFPQADAPELAEIALEVLAGDEIEDSAELALWHHTLEDQARDLLEREEER